MTMYLVMMIVETKIHPVKGIVSVGSFLFSNEWNFLNWSKFICLGTSLSIKYLNLISHSTPVICGKIKLI